MARGHLDELQKAEKYPIRWSLQTGFTVIDTHAVGALDGCAYQNRIYWYSYVLGYRVIVRGTDDMQHNDVIRVTGHLCGEFTDPGEFPAQRPVTRSFHVSFDLRLNERLRKQRRGW